MPTVITHPAVALGLAPWFRNAIPAKRWWLVGALFSIVPDLDAIGFLVGIRYSDLLGHRGLTHSLAFAAVLALAAVPFAQVRRWPLFVYLFLCAASHGLLDALTDGGLGVAFFSPFSNERYFFPWRPLVVSPIGIVGFFNARSLQVLGSELVWVVVPSLGLFCAGVLARGGRRRWLAALGVIIAGVYLGVASIERYVNPRAPHFARAAETETEEAMLAEAVANLERQAETLAAQPGASCPDHFSALETGRTLRVSMFYGDDEHAGRVYDRANARAMSRVLTSRCRGQHSACGFSLVWRATPDVRLVRTLGSRRVEVNLFTSSLANDVKGQFYRELVESDVVFYMGHSRLGGGMGFDNQTAVTTAVNAVLRRPLRPVLEALRHRPTNLKMMGMFSCDSNRYFREAFQGANPSLSLILTTGDILCGPAEQASLGALESVLSKYCGRAFHEAMSSVDEPDPTMTYLVRGR